MQISLEWRLNALNLLISANVIIYILGLIFSWLFFTNSLPAGYTAFHLLAGAADYASVLNFNEWWRVTAASFLHALSPWHLLINMWGLWIVGQRLNEMFSGKWLVIFYVLTGSFGTVASLPFLPNSYTVGASAAVFGFVGVYLAARLRKRFNAVDIDLDWAELTPYIFILLFGFISTDTGINTWAHIAGFFCGVTLGWLVPHSGVVMPAKIWKRIETIGYWSTVAWLAIVLITAILNFISVFKQI